VEHPQLIHPYPAELEEELEHAGRHLVLRPIRPQDAAQHCRFLSLISPEDLRARFFDAVRQLPEAELAHFTHIDYDREMAFVAVGRDADGGEEILGVARACIDPNGLTAEFAVLVRSDLKGRGLGRLLMDKLIRYCRARGLRELWGSILTENVPMRGLAHSLGFRVRGTECSIEEVVLNLQAQSPPLAQFRRPPAGGPTVSPGTPAPEDSRGSGTLSGGPIC
jgi:acetyltransferase